MAKADKRENIIMVWLVFESVVDSQRHILLPQIASEPLTFERGAL